MIYFLIVMVNIVIIPFLWLHGWTQGKISLKSNFYSWLAENDDLTAKEKEHIHKILERAFIWGHRKAQL